MTKRKLVTVRKIYNIENHPNADTLEIVCILGWKTVVKKGEFKVGDYVIWIEIDSWIPTELAPFLSKGKGPREYNGVKGEKLKTIRLRGVLSQGLLLPLKPVFEKYFHKVLESYQEANSMGILNSYVPTKDSEMFAFELHSSQLDLSQALNIQKWEAPIPAQLSGVMRGNFPSFISKTDQERIQNVWEEYKEKYNEVEFEVTLKLDGTSFTCYTNNGEFGVCSRNMELQEGENTYWRMAKKYLLQERLVKLSRNLAIQGEIVGEGIQKNIEKFQGQHLYVFDIYDIDAGKYLTREARMSVLEALNEIQIEENHFPVNHIPTLEYIARRKLWDLEPHIADNRNGTVLSLSTFNSLEELLALADGESIRSTCREGLVFKSISEIDGQILSFKVISNKFLLQS